MKECVFVPRVTLVMLDGTTVNVPLRACHTEHEAMRVMQDYLPQIQAYMEAVPTVRYPDGKMKPVVGMSMSGFLGLLGIRDVQGTMIQLDAGEKVLFEAAASALLKPS